MTFGRFSAAIAALSLAAAPVAAQPGPAPAPAGEEAEGSEMRAALVLPGLVLLVSLLIVLILTSGGDEPAVSP